MFRQLFLNFSHLLQNVLLLGLRRDFLNEIRQKCTKYTFEKGKEINFAVLFSICLLSVNRFPPVQTRCHKAVNIHLTDTTFYSGFV